MRITYLVRDHQRNIKRSITKTFPIIDDTSSTIALDSSEIKASTSKSRQVVLREVSNSDSGTKRFVEVWAASQLEASLDVTKYHDVFHTDGEFTDLREDIC